MTEKYGQPTATISLSQAFCRWCCNEGRGGMFQDFGMDSVSDYAKRPVAFLLRYVHRRAVSHAAILLAVVGAVGCSVSSQYGVKFLVDTLSSGPGNGDVWLAFALLVSLIAADNFLWRLAGWIASHASASLSNLQEIVRC